MADISIIILNYNTKELLAQTLDSVNHSSCSSISVETIVSDNGSTDGSIEILKQDYPWVRLIENGENLGFSAGNNRGIAVATGRYVLFLNSDVKVIDDAIAHVYSQMERDPSVGIGGCYVELVSGGIDPACHRGFPTPWRAFCYYSGLEKLVSRMPLNGIAISLRTLFGGYHMLGKDLHTNHEIDACIGAFMMVRREEGEKIGWWDEDFFMYGEDLDFCYKVKENGKKVMFYPGAKILHFKHQSGLKKSSAAQIMTLEVQSIKRKTTTAFYDAMTIFYHKHYMKVYPRWVTGIVLWFVEFKKQRAISKIK